MMVCQDLDAGDLNVFMCLFNIFRLTRSSDLQINKDEGNIRSCKSYAGSFPHTHRLVFVSKPKQMTSDLMSMFAETPTLILEMEHISENHKHVEGLMEKLSVGPVFNLTSWRLCASSLLRFRPENHEVTERRRSRSGLNTLNTAGRCLVKKHPVVSCFQMLSSCPEHWSVASQSEMRPAR